MDPSSSMGQKREQAAYRRAGKRAVIGKRPAGVGLGNEADELSDEENAMEDEKVRPSAQDVLSHSRVE